MRTTNQNGASPAYQPGSSETLINRLIVEADEAGDTLRAARAELFGEYNERARKLRDLKLSLHVARSRGERELFDVATLLSPELARLLADPLHNL